MKRISSLDVARGFAVIIMCYANTQLAFVTTYSSLDEWTARLSVVFFNNSFYPLFSLLFGVGFFLLLTGTKATRQSFVIRLLLLFCIGALHAILLNKGDILTRYALLGLVLPFALRIRSIYLVMISLNLWGISLLLGLGSADGYGTGSPDTTHLLESFAESVLYRANLFGGNLLLDLFFYGPMFIGFFCLGIVLGRAIRNPAPWHQTFLRFSAGSLLLSVPFIYLGTESSSGVFQVLTYLIAKPIYSFGLTAGVVLIYQSWGRHLLRPLIPLGKLTLSHYIGQSLLFTLIYPVSGLGLYQSIGSAGGFVVSTLILLVQLKFSQLWLRHYNYGPLESLWRQTSASIDALTHFSSRIKPTRQP